VDFISFRSFKTSLAFISFLNNFLISGILWERVVQFAKSLSVVWGLFIICSVLSYIAPRNNASALSHGDHKYHPIKSYIGVLGLFAISSDFLSISSLKNFSIFDQKG
jgi:cytochrome c oxidase subunit IV